MFLVQLALFGALETFAIYLQDPFIMILSTLLFVTLSILVAYIYLLEKNERIGIKGEEIYLQSAFKSRCVTSAKEIILKDKLSFLELSSKGVKVKLSVNIQNPNMGYDKGEIAKYLLPLLKDNKIFGFLESKYLEAKNRPILFTLKATILVFFASIALFMAFEQRVFTILLKSFFDL